MYRRLLMTALIGVFAFSVCWGAEVPAGATRNEDHRQPGLDGHVDIQFISAQKHQLSVNVDDVLPSSIECKTEFRSNVEHITYAAPRLAAIAQSLPLRI